MSSNEKKDIYKLIGSLSNDERTQLIAYLNESMNTEKTVPVITQEELDLIYSMANRGTRK
ncbi:hypothetical protein L4C38_15300 [Vibrio kasasachensis]|uniref:hypothetical protein n=1 Tax=Vibrio kasasachensis TaxID=2910248 RepID=UPI003D0FA6CC